MPRPDVERWLADAVAFANERCWGSLAAAVFIHPETERWAGPPCRTRLPAWGLQLPSTALSIPGTRPPSLRRRRHKPAFEAALERLRYGSIVVNCPTIVSYAVSSLPWGAYGCGGCPAAIGSGSGHVHNTLLFDHVQKGVLRCPFVYRWAGLLAVPCLSGLGCELGEFMHCGPVGKPPGRAAAAPQGSPPCCWAGLVQHGAPQVHHCSLRLRSPLCSGPPARRRPRRPKPFWWPSNTNTEVVGQRSMQFIQAVMDNPLVALMHVNRVAFADLRG